MAGAGGRMALTNYLMQSVVCALVFTAWGARQMGLWSPLEAGGLALVIFLAQTAASAWWMRRHAWAGGVVPARVDGGRLAAMAPDVG